MNREQFVNKEIVNKDNQKGIVVSFDENLLVVRYEKEQKTYSPDIAFKSKYLSFLDEGLNKLIDEYISNKEQEESEKEQTRIRNHSLAIARNKRVSEGYAKLSAKNDVLHHLFGKDFEYPPFVKFMKQYRHLISDGSDRMNMAFAYAE